MAPPSSADHPSSRRPVPLWQQPLLASSMEVSWITLPPVPCFLLPLVLASLLVQAPCLTPTMSATEDVDKDTMGGEVTDVAAAAAREPLAQRTPHFRVKHILCNKQQRRD